MTAKRIVYLACPYTDPNPEIRKLRYNAANRAAADLIEKGFIVYSPITMTHPLDILLAADGATLGTDYWVAFDEAFMEACAEIFVLQIDGWDRSEGVKREVNFFVSVGRPITYITPASDA